MERRREVGRGERVLPGLWRLRLPLPWAGVPHCNAWAIAAGSGIVLVDTGMHGPGSLGHLERALDQVGLRLDLVNLVVCTHAHTDHWGEVATVVERTGCDFWLHPDHAHGTEPATDPDRALAERLEVGRQSGVPDSALEQYAEQAKGSPTGIAKPLAPDRPLVDGVTVDTDLGRFEVIETPGHAPSHVCLLQRERRIMISGDHLLGRISLYFDWGWTPDPVGEFLASLDRVEPLDVRLCLAGHGKPFLDYLGHVDGTRALVEERLEGVGALLGQARAPLQVAQIAEHAPDAPSGASTAIYRVLQTLCYLRHLEVLGRARRREDDLWELAT